MRLALVIVSILYASFGFSSEKQEPSFGRDCIKHVEFYFEFERYLLEGEAERSPSKLFSFVRLLDQHELDEAMTLEIIGIFRDGLEKVTEYEAFSAKCIGNGYFVDLMFKVKTTQADFTRLFVQINDNKITAVSEELSISQSSIDQESNYVEIGYKRNVVDN